MTYNPNTLIAGITYGKLAEFILDVVDDPGGTGVPASEISNGTFGAGLTVPDTGIYSFPSQVGVGTTGLAQNGIRVGGTITAASALGAGVRMVATLAAAANSDALSMFSALPAALTPGAFTGLVVRGLQLGAFSTAAFTSPGDPRGVDIGIITGTGATNAFGVLIGAPTGATNNYLIRDSVGGVFEVLAAGNVGIGTAALVNNVIRLGGSATGSGNVFALSGAATLVASGNNANLVFVNITATGLTPGAFTGVQYGGLNIGAATVAGFTTPANPYQVQIGTLTGTGATEASALIVSPPTGAATNYAIRFPTAATFNVLDTGALTSASSLTYGTAGSVAQQINGVAGAATTAVKLVKVVTGIADNTATTVLTLTVPNVAAAGVIRITLVGVAGAGGAIGAKEDVTSVSYNLSYCRTVGVALGATMSTAFGSAAAVVVGAGTMTCVAAVTLTGEGVGATNTATIKVTIDQSSTAANHRCNVYAEIVNDVAGGGTIA